MSDEQARKRTLEGYDPAKLPKAAMSLFGPSGELWEVYADGHVVGFPEGTKIINRISQSVRDNQIQPGYWGLPANQQAIATRIADN